MNYSAKCQTEIKHTKTNVTMQVSGQSSVDKYKNKHKVTLQVLVHNKSYFKQRSKQDNIASVCTQYTGLASAVYSRQPPGDWRGRAETAGGS
jgi:hypothetical protein